MKKIVLDDVGEEVRASLSRQHYGQSPAIEGVQLVELRPIADDQGSFMEIIRCDAEGRVLAMPHFSVRQSNFAEVLPGAVKAWHLHLGQEDLWFVPPTERLLVGLYDVRKDSATYGVTTRFVMGGGKARLLYIPRGVAHGVANPWTRRSVMVYFVNQHFRADEADEYRLPWDVMGKKFWRLHKG